MIGYHWSGFIRCNSSIIIINFAPSKEGRVDLKNLWISITNELGMKHIYVVQNVSYVAWYSCMIPCSVIEICILYMYIGNNRIGNK